ncbi:ATP-binding cassette domain-containing protein [Campylobacter sp. LR291e]|uniref:ABC transporter permease n=1 Tax=Campylobacter sp. LR291e TaxID=2593546 RepID=UPI00123864A3|nr:ABC transporter permease [Campylobacter sp. LR291e]KAA6229664.1 ATP-binding cassette domain-containing protein [Campylobacter sp. LR291e]
MIHLKDINKTIGQTAILRDINLHIEKGEFVAIIGQSGSGKTTLLNIIGTLDEPSSGSFIFDKYEVTTLSKDDKARLRREKIGFIFQRYNLLSLLSANDNVSLPAVYAGKSTYERDERAKKLLNDLELNNKYLSKPNELSGGQQQRVSIARALMNGGELILADEPTGALDSKSGIMVLEILKELNDEGHTIVLVTHDPQIASRAKRIIEIKDGRILSDSKGGELKQRPQVKKMPIEKKTFLLLKNQAFECLKIAYSSIIAHKMRSLLTMLGIIIGIASVVCVVALGLGSQEKVLASIARLGTNTIEVKTGRGFGDTRSDTKRLNLSDLTTLRSLPYLDAVEATVSSSGIVTYKELSLNASGQGVGINEFSIKGYTFSAGQSFSENDLKTSANVAVIDYNAHQNLFANVNARDILDKNIIFSGKSFRIIGVLEKNTQRMFDDSTVRVYMPYTTMMNKITGSSELKDINTKIKDDADPILAEQAIIRILEIKRGQKDFFTINSNSIKQAVEENQQTLTLMITCIAIISLIVGGIGVMNIMLVSVSERTREIGIRMAIGARKEDILMQFLIEAVMICAIGAILGVILSIGVVFAFNTFSENFPMILSATSVIIGLLSSVFIGVIFGFFPAKNAANLNPISALSKE